MTKTVDRIGPTVKFFLSAGQRVFFNDNEIVFKLDFLEIIELVPRRIFIKKVNENLIINNLLRMSYLDVEGSCLIFLTLVEVRIPKSTKLTVVRLIPKIVESNDFDFHRGHPRNLQIGQSPFSRDFQGFRKLMEAVKIPRSIDFFHLQNFNAVNVENRNRRN